MDLLGAIFISVGISALCNVFILFIFSDNIDKIIDLLEEIRDKK